jgi:hypothetical protein
MADARRALESSADFTRGGTPPVPDHDATERQRAERIEAEQRRLVAWAKAHGKLGGRLPKGDVGGGEHIVRLDEKADRVFKATQLGKQKGYGIALGIQATLRNFCGRTPTASTTAECVTGSSNRLSYLHRTRFDPVRVLTTDFAGALR